MKITCSLCGERRRVWKNRASEEQKKHIENYIKTKIYYCRFCRKE